MAAPLYQLTMRSGPTTGETYPLEQEETLMGRDLANDIAIGDPEVSRRHARFVKKEGTIYIEDLGSTNGTFLNGERISNPQQLRPGDVITLGENIVLVFEKASYDIDITPPTPPQKATVPEPSYEGQPPMPETFPPPPEPSAYEEPQPTPPPSTTIPPQTPRPEDVQRRQKGDGMPTWLVILIIAIVVLICIITVTLYFMPASWWCAISFDQLPGCPIP